MPKIKKMLLVDDDPTAIFIATRIIERAGFSEEVISARDGKEACETLLRHCTHSAVSECDLDLILLDINMPIMDGFEFLEAYSGMDLCCKPKVVLLSSSQHPLDMEKAQRYNVTAILAKPLDQQSLTAIFRSGPRETETMEAETV